jgi:hypothetical protein
MVTRLGDFLLTIGLIFSTVKSYVAKCNCDRNSVRLPLGPFFSQPLLVTQLVALFSGEPRRGQLPDGRPALVRRPRRLVAAQVILQKTSGSAFHAGNEQGCQIFLVPKYQNGEKYTELPQNIPNGYKIFPMAIKYFQWP